MAIFRMEHPEWRYLVIITNSLYNDFVVTFVRMIIKILSSRKFEEKQL